MKKLLFVLTALSLLTGSCLAYTVTGHVYLKGTTTPVESATVSISSGGSGGSTTTDRFGSFSIGWPDSNMVNNTITLSASKGFLHGQTTWVASQNSENKNVYVSSTIELDPSLNLQSMPAHWTGAEPGPTTVNSSVYLNSTVGTVQVQSAVIDISFNDSIQNVMGVEPSPFVEPYIGSFTVDSPPGSGLLHIDVVFATPYPVEQFPAESFFDVTYEVDIPEDDATIGTVSIDNASFLIPDIPDPIEVLAPPCLTEYLVGEPAKCQMYFSLDSEEEWNEGLIMEWPQANITPMTPAEWNDPDPNVGYMAQWNVPEWLEGDPYPPVDFIEPNLYVWEGGDPVEPNDAGLVMTWGDAQSDPPLNEGQDYGSAWKWDYGLDPDLSNCKITVTATPPAGINNISLGLQDINGLIRSWQWTCGAGGVLASGVPTTITIDTSMTGTGAATPVSSGYVNNPGFNIRQVQFIVADENGTWVASQATPAPGGTIPAMWNYWHNLSVTPKAPASGADSKWFVKWSQPPDVIDANEPPLINGWDEMSMTQRLPNDPNTPIMADDWLCEDERPITDIHWWGSFYRIDPQTGQRIPWTKPFMPPIVPSAFHIGIWTNQPDPNPTPGFHDGVDWSFPLTLIWENECETAIWNFAGYDLDPRVGDPDQGEDEACFQWAQFLSQDEWFWQDPVVDGTLGNIYWLSIAAIYPAGTDFTSPDFYAWGWKTRPHNFEDDAVRIQQTQDGTWPPVIGTTLAMTNCDPVEWQGESWDLAFELTTNEPPEPTYQDDPIPGDITGPGGDMIPDKSVDINDFAIVALHWLETAP